MKTIVLCLDGTNDFAAENPTHVFRLFWKLDQTPQQIVYYDGGVGTLTDQRIQTKLFRKLYNWIDLATGTSIRRNVTEAYRFLAQNYEPKDRIVVFGFSRGAYAARVLCAMVHRLGIPRSSQANIADFAWQKFFEIADNGSPHEAGHVDWNELDRMRSAFGQDAFIDYLGIWDTVSSFGLFQQRTFPGTAVLSAVINVRHAISIDERRNMFPANLLRRENRPPSHLERWFAGVHRDVGGGGNSDALELSMIPYGWVVEGVSGLKTRTNSPFPKSIQENACGKDNASKKVDRQYFIVGLIPMKWYRSEPKPHYAWKWLNFVHQREIPKDAVVDPSVFTRMECSNLNYRPKNIETFHKSPADEVEDVFAS